MIFWWINNKTILFAPLRINIYVCIYIQSISYLIPYISLDDRAAYKYLLCRAAVINFFWLPHSNNIVTRHQPRPSLSYQVGWGRNLVRRSNENVDVLFVMWCWFSITIIMSFVLFWAPRNIYEAYALFVIYTFKLLDSHT